MKIETLENYIKHTSIPYGDILKRAEKGGLEIDKKDDGTVIVKDNKNKTMILYFENSGIYENNKTIGLIKTEYNF